MKDPITGAGLNLWEWSESDARPIHEFGFANVHDAIVAIEGAAYARGLANRAVPLQEAASFLPLEQIQRLRAIEEWARHLVALGNRPGLDDEEWEAVFTELEDALR